MPAPLRCSTMSDPDPALKDYRLLMQRLPDHHRNARGREVLEGGEGGEGGSEGGRGFG